MIGRRYTPVLVFTVTALTNPSLPGWTLTTLAIGHLCGTTLSSRSTRTSPTSVFLVELCHLENRLRLTRYSEDQRCQKCHTIAWHRCQPCKRGIDWSDCGGSGKASRGLPIRKWPGVNVSKSLFELSSVIGWLLRQASICVITVTVFLNVSLTFLDTRWRCVLNDLTADSHNPPKCGVCGGINFHCMHCVEQNSEMVCFVLLSSRKLANSANSLLAPTKFLPWSLHKTTGLPRLETNLRRHAMKASVVRSETSSRWTAFTDNETKMQTYALTTFGLRVELSFNNNSGSA